MNSSIRRARRDDGDFIAWVVLTAWRSHLERGLWDFFVDGGETDCLRYLEALTTSDSPHWAHYSAFLVAEVEGVPAAALAGYFDEELGMPALQKGAAQADERLGRTREESEAGLKRIAPSFLIETPHEPRAWIIENVATRPEYRRQGLIDALLAAMFDEGRRLGAVQADIGVLIGNDPAQRAYEKAGFRVVGEKRHPEFEAIWGSPGARALSQPL